MSGCSYGGIQTLLSVEKGLGVSGFIPFAPAAMSWANVELRQRLLRSLKEAKGPLFLLQAENDYRTGPERPAGCGHPPARRAEPGEAVSGVRHDESAGARRLRLLGHGTRIWGTDVMAFINTVLARNSIFGSACPTKARPRYGI